MTPSADPSPHMRFDPFLQAEQEAIGRDTIELVRLDPFTALSWGFLRTMALALAVLAVLLIADMADQAF